jgi:hypothetical protein
MSKSTPAQPDYRGAAEETARSNQEAMDRSTWANRPDQYTPFGNTTWEASAGIDPSTGKPITSWEQYTNLNPESQRALDAQLKLTGDKSELAGSLTERMANEFGEPMDYSALPEWAGPLSSGEDARQSAEDAIYGRSTSRLDPQWEQRTEQKEAQLAARGLRPGDKAYDQAMENMGRERTDAYQQAQYGSIMGGGQEATREQGMDLTAGNFQNTGRQAQFTEEMTKRGMSLNEINAIMSGQQVGMPSMPGFNATQSAGGANYSGAARDQYGAEMDAFNADQAMWNSLMQGAGMAGGAMMMSDRRLKYNIKRLGTYLVYPWYIWQYVWGEWAVGVMADEVNEDAVVILPNGFAAVDYTRIR